MEIEILRDTIITLAFFAAIFTLIYVFLISRHRERMTILDRNIESPFKETDHSNLLKYGIISLGISVGVITGNILHYFGLEEDFSYTAMVFLFGGFGLIISFFVLRRLDK